jgi:hypothetical protein
MARLHDALLELLAVQHMWCWASPHAQSCQLQAPGGQPQHGLQVQKVHHLVDLMHRLLM